MNKFYLVLLLCAGSMALKGQEYQLQSPGGELEVRLEVADKITYSLSLDDMLLIQASEIGIELLDSTILGASETVLAVEEHSADSLLRVVNGKNYEISEKYNELRLKLEGFDLIFRAYDEGVAYRFETYFPEEIIVRQEYANFNFTGDPDIWFGEGGEEMIQWERSYYPYSSISDVPDGQFAITPCLLKYPETGVSIVVAESDLHDYPGMYVLKSGEQSLCGKWAEYPKKVQEGDYEYKRVLERFDYIARTEGTRLFPWRVMIVAKDDKELLNNELIYKLAKPQVLDDVSWVVPGKSAWEWWHDAILDGVPFPSGQGNLNLTLYKYYVDFAAAYGLEYVTLDAGWEAWYVPQLCRYAEERGVKIILWYYFNLVVVDPSILNTFKSYGAAGIKVDLIERDDQLAIQWFELIASECAKRELVVSFHGCAKPTGLQRAYPNILNFEAVRGAECTKWDYSANPNHHLQFPFMRMLAGTLDYTPGSFRNRHFEQFNPVPQGVPYTIGTRTHEVAMYVLYDQTLAYLCDAPSMYEKYPEITEMIAAIPTTWDRTLPLSGEVGEYAAMARKKGEDWFVGAMTNLKERQMEIDLSFLDPGIIYEARLMRDTKSSDVNATSSKIETIQVSDTTVYQATMARGGGLVMHISPLGLQQGMKESPGDVIQEQEISTVYYPSDCTLVVSGSGKIDHYNVYDVNGRLWNTEYNVVDEDLHISLKHLQTGLYLVAVGNKKERKTIKVLKQ